jgi:metal-responsive CopG/Arc/MetJ family transcriptional regulator
MRARAPDRRRAKISVTVDPTLLRAVDQFIEAHPETDRSKVMDEALHDWYARRQDEAMAAQYATPISDEERAEREAWRRIRTDATRRLWWPEGEPR